MISREQVETLKNLYTVGTRIRLALMVGEPQMISGMEGTVTGVDDMGQIHMRWDNGGSLAINPELDIYEVIE